MIKNIAGYRFDDYIIEIQNRQIKKNHHILPLNTKYFEVLLYLIENQQHLVTKEELFREIWSDVIVTDWALSQCIKDIRKVLQDDARNPRYIRTFPKHGFMFIGTPEVLYDEEMDSGLSAKIHRRPFKFLDYYSEEDSDLFFGRKTEIRMLCSKILGHRSFVLYGRSGVGKSSIAHAGILPALKKQGNRVYIIRNFHDPIKEMFEVLNVEEVNSTDHLLVEAVADLSKSQNTIVFIFDQFEEFFFRTAPDIRNRFLKILDTIFTNSSNQLKIVFVLREDMLAEMDSLKGVFPEIFHHVYRLMRLSKEQAFEAILEPSRQVNCQIDEDLVNTIIHDLSEKDSVDPPQLQIVCDALFDARDEKSQITLNSYEKLGGALKILSNYLDRVMQRFHSNDNDLAKSILKTLVSEDKQRLLLEKKQIIGNIRNGVHSAPQIENIIAELAKSRLIRYRREDGKILIELTHDFLVDEILKWYSEEEILLRRIREIFETAYQNYQTHRLLMDEDILDLVSPVAEQFNLDDRQTEFFCRSLLNRRKILPAWVLLHLTSARELLTDFLNSPDEDVRIATIESTALIEDDVLRNLLTQKAVWDDSLHVRKVAGIILLQKYGEDAVHSLNNPKENGNAGTFRKAITLALIRDHQRELFRLHKLPVVLSLIILGGLAWVRLRRARFYILRQTIGGSLGAGFSGLMVGFSLGGILALYRELPAYESTTLILVLTSLGGIAGFLVGSGISLGMSTMRVISYRHHPYWTITGATLGGAVIGGILHLLGVDTFLALFGQKLSNIAGAYEGALVGLGLSLGAAVGNRYRDYSFWIPVLLAACGSMIAAILLTFIEGNLFSASIESIARSFADTQIKFDALAKLFGEANFGLVSRLILGAFEGFLFGGLTILGIEIFARQKWGDLFPDY